MNVSVFLLLGAVFSSMLLLLQRTQATRRRFVGILMVPLVLLCWNYARSSSAGASAWFALAAAVFINALFWALIGRYNPVAKSEDIRVLGMDD